MAKGSKANGTVEAPIEVSTLPSVVGINFGNSYASIAVFTKEGQAECIANEDGERQIASAISFHGEEIYIGNQAKHQLIKNGKNTIIGFRNLLGKKFCEIPKDQAVTSAPVIQHPDIPDEPAYKVQVLQPAPTPLPASTPAASQAATPRSEPTPSERILTVAEVATLFLKSLIGSAEDFLGKKVTGAVLSVSSSFSPAQRAALTAAAADAGIVVLQLLDEAGAVASLSAASPPPEGAAQDRTALVVDLGQSSLFLSLLSLRHGLAYALAESHDPAVHAGLIDAQLLRFFAKDFTKKTKVPLAVAGAPGSGTGPDARAEAKLLLALEHTKRTVAASPGAATCSVESLKDGLDYTGAINRLRFDMEIRPVYAAVTGAVRALLAGAGIDAHAIDEVVYVGGSASLPGLDAHLAQDLAESVLTPFTAGTVAGGGAGDPTTVLARGCALQAHLLDALAEEEDAEELRLAFAPGSEWANAPATRRTLGVLFPEDGAAAKDGLGGQWVPVVPHETAVPARRTIVLDVDLGTSDAKRVGFEVWEVKEGVKVEMVKPPKVDDEDDEEEEEEEIEVKERTVEKETLFGGLVLDTKSAVKEKGRWRTRVEIKFVVAADGAVDVTAWEVAKGTSGEKVTLHIPARA